MAITSRPTATLLGTIASTVEQADYVIGSIGDDIISGGSDATIKAGDGIDTLEGGAGDDSYIVNDPTDKVTELANEGIDTIYTTAATYTLPAEVENGAAVPLATAAAITLTGNAKDNKLDGLQNTGAITTLIGLTGNDTYFIDGNDVVNEAANAGTDTIISATTVTLSTTVTTGLNIENVILSGSSAADITGNTLSNKLLGNSAVNSIVGGVGNDTLDGGVGDSAAETLRGGLGDDVYILRSATLDVILEDLSQGTDTVRATVKDYTLATNVENLILIGNVANGTGNSANNVLTGSSAVNTLTGGAGNDILNGGGGADTLIGEAGNDTYIITDATVGITEVTAATGGIDTVQTSVSYTFKTGIENITLTGSGSINATSATSNTTNTTITGNSVVNSLTGGDGNDNIIGNAGNDQLNGGASNDTLNGGTGNDAMDGGAGSDKYYVDSVSDTIAETGSDIDTLESTISANLASTAVTNTTSFGSGSIENLNLAGTAAIGAGNASANIINGNASNNTLTGLAENDTINGGSGTDTITGGVGADKLTGGTGTDKYIISAAGETATPAATWTAAATGSTVSTTSMDIITVTNTDQDILDLSAIASTLVSVTAERTTITAATAFTAVGTLTAVETWLGTYSALTNTFTSKATGTDTLLVYDNDGATNGVSDALEAIVLVGAATTLTVTAGVFTI
jgi:Ca2+-binding RTX toxin-like protein